jgi:hypothetical protein
LIKLTRANSPNDDPCDVDEATIEFYAVISDNAVTFTQIGFASGNTLNVKETIQEMRDAIARSKTEK